MKLRERNNQKPIVDPPTDSENELEQAKTNTIDKKKKASIGNSNADSIPLESKSKVIKKAVSKKKTSKKEIKLNEASTSKYFSDNDKSANKSKEDFVENMDSEDEDDDDDGDFVEVQVKLKKKTTPKSKDNAKKAKKQKKEEPIKSPENLISQINNVNKPKIELDIEALLKMETQTQSNNKPSKTEEDLDDEDEEDDFEEVKMEVNPRDIDINMMGISREPIEVALNTKKAAKKVDQAAKFERAFKALQKKFGIAAIKTHLLCWLNYGFYLNKICLSDEVRSFAFSMDGFQVDNFILENFNKKSLEVYLKNLNEYLKFEKSDDFLTKNLLVTNENLIQAISSQKCSNYLQYILIILIALRNLGVRVRLCVCYDVILLGEGPKLKSKTPTSSKKASKDDEDKESSDMSEEESNSGKKKSSKKGVKRKSEPKLEPDSDSEIRNSKKSKENEQVSESNRSKRKSSQLAGLKLKKTTDNDEDSLDSNSNEVKQEKDQNENELDNNGNVVKKLKVEGKPIIKIKPNNKILSSDQEDNDEVQTVTGYTTDFKNHWLEVYLEEEKKWCPIDPYSMKIDSASYLEKRFGKRVLYVVAYDNDNRAKDVTKRYSEEWPTNTRLLRISHLEEKKLWWERSLFYHQPKNANLDMEEEKELKSIFNFFN